MISGEKVTSKMMMLRLYCQAGGDQNNKKVTLPETNKSPGNGWLED